jgi:hypothetical protein
MSFAHERSYIVAARLAVACESPSASRTAHITAKNVMANIISESAGYLTGHRHQQAFVLVFSHVLKQPPIQKFATNVFRAATIGVQRKPVNRRENSIL